MPDLFLNIVLYIVLFIVLWVGSGFIISSVSNLSYRLRIPSFFISFFILGILTSTPEIAVGFSAISSDRPGIFVGNLLGGIPVIFLFIIPLLAIFGKGIKLNHNLNQENIFLSLLLAIAPFFVVLDEQVSTLEGAGLIGLYVIVAFLLQRKNDFINKRNVNLLKFKRYSLLDLGKILLGTGIVLYASNQIVSKTLYFSEVYNIAPFYISLIVLAMGTNLPEITIAFRSILSGKKDIAFGDYLGSASTNAVLFGFFSMIYHEPIVQTDGFIVAFIIVAIGLILMFNFANSKRKITPKEGSILLIIYFIFVLFELMPR